MAEVGREEGETGKMGERERRGKGEKRKMGKRGNNMKNEERGRINNTFATVYCMLNVLNNGQQ